MSERDQATVLVVDDEKTVADTYAFRLEEAFETVTAYGGEEALERLESGGIDVVLLDRRMPDLTGDEVLERIRERGYDCRVLMLTAIDPGFDAIGMPFDDYLCKPVEQEPLLHAVEQQFRIVALEQLSEYLELLAKREVIEATTDPGQREESDEYRDLVERCDALESALSAQLDNFDDLAAAFQRVDREP